MTFCPLEVLWVSWFKGKNADLDIACIAFILVYYVYWICTTKDKYKIKDQVSGHGMGFLKLLFIPQIFYHLSKGIYWKQNSSCLLYLYHPMMLLYRMTHSNKQCSAQNAFVNWTPKLDFEFLSIYITRKYGAIWGK